MSAYNKHKNSFGMSLVEAIIAMWIVGIVAFSAVICTSSIDNKSNQKRIIALIIAKKELEEKKKAIMLGTLPLKNDSYMDTQIVVLTDRVITASEVKDNYVNNLDIDPVSETFTNLFLQGKTDLGFKKGEVVLSVYPDSADGSVDISKANALYSALQEKNKIDKNNSADKIDTKDEVYRSAGNTQEKNHVLSDDRYLFISDINIQYEPVPANPNRYRYSFRIAVGWFERIKGHNPFKKEVMYAEMYTKVKKYEP